MCPRQEGQYEGQNPIDEHRPTKHSFGAHHFGYSTSGHLENKVTPEEGAEDDALLHLAPVELAMCAAVHLRTHT